jgi:hypothetical protein
MPSTDRRKFLKKLGMGSVAAGFVPSSIVIPGIAGTEIQNDKEQNQFTSKHEYNGSYSDEHLNRIAFPIGGMGAGMFCLEGTGAISHMSIRNRPEIFNEPGIFAAICIKGLKNGAKVLEGSVPDWKKFGISDAGNGLSGSTAGLPRFTKCAFEARFPFATIDLMDQDLPIRAQITGWSPFIPTDDDNSSLPVASLEYKIVNISNKAMELVFSFNSRNFLSVENGTNSINRIKNGFILSESGSKEKTFLKADFAVFTDDDAAIIDYCWFRGGWWDPLTMAWNTISAGETKK